jgi:hypothetical protein
VERAATNHVRERLEGSSLSKFHCGADSIANSQP